MGSKRLGYIYIYPSSTTKQKLTPWRTQTYTDSLKQRPLVQSLCTHIPELRRQQCFFPPLVESQAMLDDNSKKSERSSHPVIPPNVPQIFSAKFFTAEQALGALPLYPHRHAPFVIRMWAVLQLLQLVAIYHTRLLHAYATLVHERSRVGLIDGLVVKET